MSKTMTNRESIHTESGWYRGDVDTATHDTEDDELTAMRAFVVAFDAWRPADDAMRYELWDVVIRRRAAIPERRGH